MTPSRPVRPGVAEPGRMRLLEGINQLLCGCHRRSGASQTHRRTHWTCCLGGKKSIRCIAKGVAQEERSWFDFSPPHTHTHFGVRSKSLPWDVSMCTLLISALSSRRKRSGVGFEGVHLGGVEAQFSVLTVSGAWGGGDHGGNGEGRAPAATSVPVPRPVARGLADRRQVRMQLFASFTRDALSPLRICAPSELITLTKRYQPVSHKHFLTVVSLVRVH